MTKEQRECAWGRIEFYTKLLLADLLIFSALVGWAGTQVNVGEFGVMFIPTCVAIGTCVTLGVYLFLAITKDLGNLEANSK